MKCTFCSSDIPAGSGTMFIRKTGKISYYCSSKCEKNMIKLKRNPAKTRWTATKAQ